MKTLIVFYSRTGRTAATARKLAHEMENTSRLEITPMAYRGTAREYLHYLYCTLTRKPANKKSSPKWDLLQENLAEGGEKEVQHK